MIYSWFCVQIYVFMISLFFLIFSRLPHGFHTHFGFSGFLIFPDFPEFHIIFGFPGFPSILPLAHVNYFENIFQKTIVQHNLNFRRKSKIMIFQNIFKKNIAQVNLIFRTEAKKRFFWRYFQKKQSTRLLCDTDLWPSKLTLTVLYSRILAWLEAAQRWLSGSLLPPYPPHMRFRKRRNAWTTAEADPKDNSDAQMPA